MTELMADPHFFYIAGCYGAYALFVLGFGLHAWCCWKHV